MAKDVGETVVGTHALSITVGYVSGVQRVRAVKRGRDFGVAEYQLIVDITVNDCPNGGAVGCGTCDGWRVNHS